MALHILRCPKCNKFSMNPVCRCGTKTIQIKPPKYSPQEKYVELKRKVKRKEFEEKGLL